MRFKKDSIHNKHFKPSPDITPKTVTQLLQNPNISPQELARKTKKLMRPKKISKVGA